MKRLFLCCLFLSLALPSLGCGKKLKDSKPGEGKEMLDPAAMQKASALPEGGAPEAKK